MAIGPDVLNERVNEQVKTFEVLIDEEIKKKFSGGSIEITLSATPLYKTQQILREKYTKAGWRQVFFRPGKMCEGVMVYELFLSEEPPTTTSGGFVWNVGNDYQPGMIIRGNY